MKKNLTAAAVALGLAAIGYLSSGAWGAASALLGFSVGFALRRLSGG